jgi:hypothetical protein
MVLKSGLIPKIFNFFSQIGNDNEKGITFEKKLPAK